MLMMSCTVHRKIMKLILNECNCKSESSAAVLKNYSAVKDLRVKCLLRGCSSPKSVRCS